MAKIKRDYPLSETPSPKGYDSSGQEIVRGSRPPHGVFKTTKERTTSGGLLEPYKYTRESIDTSGYSKGKKSYQLKTESGEGDKTGSRATSSKSQNVSRKDVPSILDRLKNK